MYGFIISSRTRCDINCTVATTIEQLQQHVNYSQFFEMASKWSPCSKLYPNWTLLWPSYIRKLGSNRFQYLFLYVIMPGECGCRRILCALKTFGNMFPTPRCSLAAPLENLYYNNIKSRTTAKEVWEARQICRRWHAIAIFEHYSVWFIFGFFGRFHDNLAHTKILPWNKVGSQHKCRRRELRRSIVNVRSKIGDLRRIFIWRIARQYTPY